MTLTPSPILPLNDGNTIPQLGLGVYKVAPEQAADNVRNAIEVGYRHIDTAALYRNEEGVGEGIRASGIDRDEVFVTTKVWNDRQGYDETLAAFGESLERLALDYVDLYLIHWPCPTQDQYRDTWRALEKLRVDGLVRSIGVSNFHQAHLDRLAENSSVVPVLNQIELHPYLQQAELRRYNAEHGILTEAWAPLGRGAAMSDPVLVDIAAAHDVTVAQAIVRWQLQLGHVVIPKTNSRERMIENFDVFGFELSSEEMERIAGLDRGERQGPNPDEFN